MLNDITPSPRQKRKTIHPLEKPNFKPLPSFESLQDEPPVEPTKDDTPETSSFKTPEEIAAAEETEEIELVNSETKLATNVLPAKAAKDKTNWLRTLLKKWPLDKRKTIILATVLVLLGAGGVAYGFTRPTVKGGRYVVKSKYIKPVPKITTVASGLTGLQVDPSVNKRPVTGIMIENSTDARPQSGIDQAGVVFEAIAEGGITRFLTLFQDTQPDYLGPVRSARPYYVQWCMGFDCSLAHAGGSPEALADIPAWGTKNLDQFANSGAFDRISSRYAPHNLYTSMAQLNQLEATKGYGASTFTGFTRKKDAASKVPTAASIDFALSGFYFNPHFDYDVATNSYKRSQAGAPHMMLNKDGSQVQITPKVVVAMVMQYGLEADDHHSQYNVVGNGQAFIFQDGIVTQGTWSKTDTKSPLTLTGADGKSAPLNAGQTWLTAVGAANQVTYK